MTAMAEASILRTEAAVVTPGAEIFAPGSPIRWIHQPNQKFTRWEWQSQSSLRTNGTRVFQVWKAEWGVGEV